MLKSTINSKLAKAISMALALIILVSCFAITAYAEGGNNAEDFDGDASKVVLSGYCGSEGDGKNLSWKLTGDGKLTISGSGKMKNYAEAFENHAAPWYCDDSSGKRVPYHHMIKSVVIESNVTSIGNEAFAGCENLTSIEIPNSVTSIGECAFNGCKSLESITIPNGVSSIGESAFIFCYSLTSITIPESVTTVGPNLFDESKNLKDIYCEAKSQPSGWDSDWNKNSWLNGSTVYAATIHWGWKPATNNSSAKSDNPKTGIALSVIPMVLALAAASFKKR